MREAVLGSLTRGVPGSEGSAPQIADPGERLIGLIFIIAAFFQNALSVVQNSNRTKIFTLLKIVSS
jgi:hypothetical protein